MNSFSELFTYLSEAPGPVSLSHKTRRAAVLIKDSTIAVINCLNGEMLAKVECMSKVRSIDWSLDDSMILVLTEGGVCVYLASSLSNLENRLSDPLVSLSDGILEVHDVIWSPCSKKFLFFSEHSVVLGFYVIGKGITHLPSPKSYRESFCFSTDGSRFAFLGNQNGKDVLFIGDTGTMKVKKPFILQTIDAKRVIWSSDDTHILVPDCKSRNFLEIVDSNLTNSQKISFYDGYLGVSAIGESSNSKLITVGNFDNYIRLLVAPDWKVLSEFLHEPVFMTHSTQIYVEVGTGFELAEPPYEVPTREASGISSVRWSPSGLYFASTTYTAPSLMYIWNSETVSLSAVLSFQRDIDDFGWKPDEDTLCIVCSSSMLTYWTPGGIQQISIPSSVRPDKIVYSEDSTVLALLDSRASSGIFVKEAENDLLSDIE